MLWSPIDVAAALRDNGIRGRQNRIIGVAVCRAESHFNDQARLDNTTLTPPGKGIDRGLFQINSFWQPQVTDEMAFDGAENIRQAVLIYRANDNTWNPWAAYLHGNYKAYLEMAEVAVDAEIRLRDARTAADDQAAQIADLTAQLAAANATIAARDGQISVQQTRLDAAAAELDALRRFSANFDAWVAELRS